MVYYKYDAWGNILSITGSLASTIGQINPFRYRSYYYDVESGFYYLNSRYYDPSVGRFLNADGAVSTGTGILGFNMFAYCNNNPVNLIDSMGTCPHDGRGIMVLNPDCTECNPTKANITADALEAFFFLSSYSLKNHAINFSNQASAFSSATYLAGGVYRNIPSALGSKYTVLSNRMSTLSNTAKVASKVAKVAGIALLVTDCSISVYNNFTNDNLTTERKISDSIVDVGVSVGGFWATVGTASAIGTAFGPGYGTAAGLTVGVAVYVITEYTPVVDWAKAGAGYVADGISSGIDWISSLFK